MFIPCLIHFLYQVRNEYADDFLSLIKQREHLCICFNCFGTYDSEKHGFNFFFETEDSGDDEEIIGTGNEDPEVYEVGQVLDICYGDPNRIKKRGLYCKVSAYIIFNQTDLCNTKCSLSCIIDVHRVFLF